jgi:phage gp36-like protein
VAYIVRADLDNRFTAAEISQLESGGRDVGKAMSDAEDEVNSYLSVRYAVPVSPVPERVKEVSCDIARFRLFTIESEGEPKERYVIALSWLKDVQAGRANLIGVSPLAEGGSAPGLGRATFGQARSGFDWDGYGACG